MTNKNPLVWDELCRAFGECTTNPPTVATQTYAEAMQAFYDALDVVAIQGNVTGRAVVRLCDMVKAAYVCGYREAQIADAVKG